MQINQPIISSKSNTQQSEDPCNPFFPLLDAPNPILPPGTYTETHSPLTFRYRFNPQPHKFHQTSFSERRGKEWANKSTQPPNHISINIPINHEFQHLIESKALIYQRINNQSLNIISYNRSKVYASVFFNAKDIHCKCIPIYQHLNKINKQQSYHHTNDKLTFNSSFECGNLFSVVRSHSNALPTYELYLQNDTNTKGCTQWFYFSVSNKGKMKVKFRLMNFYKSSSLFSQGMKILCSKDQLQWRKAGIAIQYGRIPLSQETFTYHLDFIFDFQTTNDTTYFAYGFPYTYAQHLSNLLNKLSSPPLRKIIRREVLCQSSMGNNIYILNINQAIIKQRKPMVYIIGRQHPGETPSSYIMDGLINFISSERVQAQEIRKKYHFRIVPMVNVDGVISGNYRSNCSGNDINRQWDLPSKNLHPQIYHLKKQILINKKHVVFFLDIHAHSRKMNSFFYGSKLPQNQNQFYPFVCSKLNKMISYDDCYFGDDTSKKSTARVILQNQLKIINSLTFEASFYGWQDKQKNNKHHFKMKDYYHIGQALALGLFYSQIAINQYLKTYDKSKELTTRVSKEKFKSQDEKIKNFWERIEINSQRIYLKWKKTLEMEKNTNPEKQYSEGSSIDPQHFQLQAQQEKTIMSNRFHTIIEKPKEIKPKQQSHIIQTIDKNCHNEESSGSIILEKGRGNQLIIKKSRQTLLIYPIQSNLRNSMIVKQLQSELQIIKRKNQKGISNRKKKLAQIANNSQYRSLDYQKGTNYKYNVFQIKKALRYYLSTKNEDNGIYQKCFKSFNNEEPINIGYQNAQKNNSIKKK